MENATGGTVTYGSHRERASSQRERAETVSYTTVWARHGPRVDDTQSPHRNERPLVVPSRGMGSAGTDAFTTDERRALAAMARRFVDVHVLPGLPDWEERGIVPLSLHAEAAEAGLLGIDFPEDLGGSGGDVVDVAVMTEAMIGAGASGGLVSALFTHGIALPHVVDHVRRLAATGNQDAAHAVTTEVVRPVLAGQSVISLAVTEPDGGSDVARLRTRATSDGSGGWRVTGDKSYITSATRAEHLVVAARTGGSGAGGISLGLVRSDAAGVSVSAPLSKMGWRCSDTALISFDSAPMQLLGEAGGFASLARHFATERLLLAIIGYSTAQRCLDLAAAWTKDRHTFGRPLATRQVVQHELVQMHRITDVARAYSRDVIVRAAAGEEVSAHAILAKETAVEAAERVADSAVQLFGGLGYMTGTEVERHYRDVRILSIGGGATEVMTDLAARLLGYTG